ncbi:MFS transporter [Paenibacillus protaetiae]|uniref:MFS transporter n=1 Tax=Paenibacillus protaetiae TaxID=2509456 RepID=A0A4P6EZF6_9BACL|nr:MFS transporter [Paenibacillus protaetiae]QAY68532.1 MFS transporter [Paenibacillus protaetiae]
MISKAASSALAFRYRFILLLAVVLIAGMSQGLLLPLLAILLDRAGVSSDMNGLNSTALYIGVFCTMFVVERPVLRFGYRKVIMAGLVLLAASLLLFPLSSSLAVWFALRLIVGAGDSALHYASQLWIVSMSPADRRGRYISLYGMAYGIGFSIGPLGINLLPYGDIAPFAAVSLLCAAVGLLMLNMPDDKPERHRKQASGENRFLQTYRMAWFVLIPGLLYGLMEASMNTGFPLYGLRIGLTQHEISLLLLAFGCGSLVLQLPLGIWSDQIGRKPVLTGSAVLGAALFLLVPAAGSGFWALFLLFAAAGGLVGSFYSLGLAYAADLLPKAILPAANVIASIHFSIGSVLGPALGGYGIRYVSLYSVFWCLGAAFFIFAVSGFWFRRQKKPV